jgi:hypothetical protein
MIVCLVHRPIEPIVQPCLRHPKALALACLSTLCTVASWPVNLELAPRATRGYAATTGFFSTRSARITCRRSAGLHPGDDRSVRP